MNTEEDVQKFYDKLAALVIEYQKYYRENNKDKCTEIFNEIYSITYPYIRAIVNKKHYNLNEFDDVLQEVYLNIYKNLPNIDKPQYFYSYIQKACRTAIKESYMHSEQGKIDHENKKKSEDETQYSLEYLDLEDSTNYGDGKEINETDLINYFDVPEKILESQDTVRYIYDSVRDKLSEEQFIILLMSTQEQKNCLEISKETRIAQHTVYRYCKTALQVVKETILSIEKTEGIKLHKVAVAPFIGGLIYAYSRTQDVSAAEISAHYDLIQHAINGASSVGVASIATGAVKTAASGSVKGSVAKTAGITLGKKIAIGAVCVAVGGTGIGVGVIHHHKDEPNILTGTGYMLLYVGEDSEDPVTIYQQYHTEADNGCTNYISIEDGELTVSISSDGGVSFTEYRMEVSDNCTIATQTGASFQAQLDHIDVDQFNSYISNPNSVGDVIRIMTFHDLIVEVTLCEI